MQCRAFSVNHILAPTQNSQRRKLQTSPVTQKGNCDPLVNMLWFHYVCQPLTTYSLYLTGHPNPIIVRNVHHPQHICAHNNADHFFLRHFLCLTNLLIQSPDLPPSIPTLILVSISGSLGTVIWRIPAFALFPPSMFLGQSHHFPVSAK